MNISKKELIEKFNKGTLTEEEANRLETLFLKEEINLDNLETYQLYSDKVDNVAMSSNLDSKFHEMLAEEMEVQKQKELRKNWFQYLPLPIKLALPALLLFCGFMVGKNWNQSNQVIASTSISENSVLIKDILDHPLTSKRIRAVNLINQSDETEEQIIKLLFLSLNHDKSSNVRMAAIDGLIKYAEKASVREGLINSIREQDSPLVLQYLSEALKIIGAQIPLEKFRKLYNDDIPVEIIKEIEPNLHTI